MGNTIVKGGAPAIPLVGTLSDGILLQNLSVSVPLFLGYDSSVSSNSYSAYVPAGGTYTSGQGKNLYVYADSDCPMVFDYTPDAQSSGGSLVSATLVNSQTPLFDSGTNPFSVPGPSGSLMLNPLPLDMSTGQFVYGQFSAQETATWVTAGLFQFAIQWLDSSKRLILEDVFDFLPFSRVKFGVAVKGRYANLILRSDVNAVAHTWLGSVALSTLAQPDYYDHEPYYFFPSTQANSFNGINNFQYNDRLVSFSAYRNDSAATAFFVPRSRAKRVVGNANYSGSGGTLILYAWPFGFNLYQALYASIFSTVNPNSSYDKLAPRSPIFWQMIFNSAGNTVYLGMVYDS